MIGTLAHYIESRRRVATLHRTFKTCLVLTDEQRKQLNDELENQTDCSPEEFTEAFVGWLTEDTPEETKAGKKKR